MHQADQILDAPSPNLGLTPEEKTTIKQMNESMKGCKELFADAALEELMAMGKKHQLAQRLAALRDGLENYLGEVAGKRGVDLKDPSKGRWTFNLQSLEFVKLG